MDSLLRYPTPYLTTTELHVLLQGYRQPAAAIARLEQRGILKRLRRGLYWIDGHTDLSLSQLCLVANWIKVPSYVSFETALSLVGWIPEAVFSVTSASPSRQQALVTPIGQFLYYQLSLTRGATGIEFQAHGGTVFRCAGPERALIDWLDRERYKAHSDADWQALLFDHLRIDADLLAKGRRQVFKQLAEQLHPRSAAALFWQWWAIWSRS